MRGGGRSRRSGSRRSRRSFGREWPSATGLGPQIGGADRSRPRFSGVDQVWAVVEQVLAEIGHLPPNLAQARRGERWQHGVAIAGSRGTEAGEPCDRRPSVGAPPPIGGAAPCRRRAALLERVDGTAGHAGSHHVAALYAYALEGGASPWRPRPGDDARHLIWAGGGGAGRGGGAGMCAWRREARHGHTRVGLETIGLASSALARNRPSLRRIRSDLRRARTESARNSQRPADGCRRNVSAG